MLSNGRMFAMLLGLKWFSVARFRWSGRPLPLSRLNRLAMVTISRVSTTCGSKNRWFRNKFRFSVVRIRHVVRKKWFVRR